MWDISFIRCSFLSHGNIATGRSWCGRRVPACSGTAGAETFIISSPISGWSIARQCNPLVMISPIGQIKHGKIDTTVRRGRLPALSDSAILFRVVNNPDISHHVTFNNTT